MDTELRFECRAAAWRRTCETAGPSYALLCSGRARVSAMIRVWRGGRSLSQEESSAVCTVHAQWWLIVALWLPRNSREATPQPDHITRDIVPVANKSSSDRWPHSMQVR